MTQAHRPLVLGVSSDSPTTTAGVLALLEPFSDRVVVEPTGGVPTISTRVDVLLADAAEQPHPGDELARVRGNCSTPVLVFGCSTSEQHTDTILMYGAAGVLSRTSSGEEIVAAVEAVAAGQSWRSASVPQTRHRQGLTSREYEVLSLVAAGLSNRDIAERTDVSLNSVKSYLRSAYAKLGVSSRSQAVLWALEHPLGVGATSLASHDRR